MTQSSTLDHSPVDNSVAHTPGKWFVDETEVNVTINGIPSTICECFNHKGIGRIDSIANARLIAAAPDLLAALERIIRANDSPPGATMGEAKVCEAYAFAAREAIAKATGK